MKRINLLAILLLLLVINCKDVQKENSIDTAEDVKEILVLDSLELKLDDGDKWLANLETHEGVKLMDSIITVFKKENKEDYVVLGDDLSKQTSYIIKNCSMKGEPHDQLHVVLVPMLDEISILREQTNAAESKAALDRLEQLISSYFKYFKV
nr:hypothetical protein [uncultured Psychroserpens sp.]